MIELGVNIDHVATIRQARRTYEPDPVWAAVEAHLGGADGITVHLREDRRHIQDADVRRLRELTHIKLNLEMAATDEMVEIAASLTPEMAMLVPEGRHEITTEGGLISFRRRRGCARWWQGSRALALSPAYLSTPTHRRLRRRRASAPACARFTPAPMRMRFINRGAMQKVRRFAMNLRGSVVLVISFARLVCALTRGMRSIM